MAKPTTNVCEITTYEEMDKVITTFKDSYYLRRITNPEYKDTFIKKQLECGHFVVEYHDDNPVGFISFYSNDLNSGVSFVTAMVVSEDLGFLKGKTLIRLLTESRNIAIKNNMKSVKLEVEKDNKRAIKLYEHFGFRPVEEETDNTIFMQMDICDITQLPEE